ncbi:class I SAM-dependent methyltransferase [Paractinoplanes lichenicola]|uniref:Methyltransferase domain-containing protein n=1 Tax=Paractinoplanes lichenicola TaxID=2802976 RepID=A0ABS1VZH0_9ACTN|nr:class I SAM-dependent methyltransferase [Actinoplanes lichenicola]MBL7259892.1 methyltransferase domain-containing protein [Actinoplanes lichenicola]
MDAQTDELRDAHDKLAEWYSERLVGLLESMPIERAVLDLFCELTLAADLGGDVADIGCGTGRLLPYLAGRGVTPRGVDLAPGMIEVARRDNPGFPYEVGDVRALPFEDASLAGVVCWYSLIFLPPESRGAAFGELARVVRPGGYFVCAFKDGDGERRRGGLSLNIGIEFDAYWMSAAEMMERLDASGFSLVFQGGRPPEGTETVPQGYLVARRSAPGAPPG